MAAALLFFLCVVCFLATSLAIFAGKPLMLVLAFAVAGYALKADVEQGLERLRARSDR